jgi:hypothetical protein
MGKTQADAIYAFVTQVTDQGSHGPRLDYDVDEAKYRIVLDFCTQLKIT